MVKQFNKSDIPEINLKEVWRYAGYRGIPGPEETELNEIMADVIKQAEDKLSYRVVYLKTREIPFTHNSSDLSRTLKDCRYFFTFAATLGLGIDRLIAVNERTSTTKALLLQALGAERIEALCDRFCKEIEDTEVGPGKRITRRFSPGYGDLPLEIQKDFFRILDCNRKVGISLNESLLMSPSKSVTAIFGIKNGNRAEDCESKCEACDNKECEFRGQ